MITLRDNINKISYIATIFLNKNMLIKIYSFLNIIKDTFKKYPIVILSALINTCCFISLMYLGEYQYENFDNYEQIHEIKHKIKTLGLVSGLGISSFFGIKMASERYGKIVIFHLLGFIFLGFVYYLFRPFQDDSYSSYEQDKSMYYVFIFYFLTHLLVSFIPFLNKNNNDFWNYNKNLFINLSLSSFFTGVFTGGILLGLYMLESLLSFDVPSICYISICGILLLFTNTFIFLIFNRKGLNNLVEEEKYPTLLKIFTQYILIPLLIIYTFILYIYGLNILIKWDLPRGFVSSFIFGYSLLGIFTFLLIYPLTKEIKWIKIFFKIFFISLLPILVLLFLAVFVRVFNYGITENRYYVLILALWISMITLYFVFLKNASIKFIPISLFILGILSISTPFLNLFSLSIYSQKKELIKLLKKNNILNNQNKIDFSKKIQYEKISEINEKFYYLEIRDTLFLKNLFPPISQQNNSFSHYFVENMKSKDKEEDDIFTYKRVINMQLIENLKNYDFIGNLYSNYTLDDKYLISFEDNQMILSELNKKNQTSYNISSLLKEKTMEQIDLFDNLILHPKKPILLQFSMKEYDFVIAPRQISIKEQNNEIVECELIDDDYNLIFIKKK